MTTTFKFLLGSALIFALAACGDSADRAAPDAKGGRAVRQALVDREALADRAKRGVAAAVIARRWSRLGRLNPTNS
jgi:hypothetical protein